MRTLDELKLYQPIGNASSDGEALMDAHRIAANYDNPMEDRLEALRQMDRIMGLDDLGTEVTVKDLYDYLYFTASRSDR